MARGLQPAPLKPPWMLGQPAPRRLRIPLVHAARVEQQCPVACFCMRAVSVAENDCIGARKSTEKGIRQAVVRLQVAEAQRPEQCLRFLDPMSAVAVHQHDLPSLDRDLSTQREGVEIPVVITADCYDRCDALELGDGLRAADIPGMQDQVDATQDLVDSLGQMIEKFWAVSVRDHPDASGQPT